MENIEKVVSSGVDALKRTSASIVNGVVAFGEGLVSFGEAIVDAGIMIGGAVHSVRTAGSDIATGLLTGDWSFSKTKATWTDKIMPAIAYNATDKMFDTLYDTKFMKNVEKNSYDAMKREGGGVYNFVKDVGYYTGVTLVSTVTLGGGALPTALTVGTASLGRNAQKNYGAVLDNAAKTGNEITWADIGKATGQTVSTAVVDGAVGYLAGNLKGLENSATTFGQKVLTGWLGPAGLQSGKVFVSEAINCAWTGEEYDFAETVKEAAAVITAETICFGVGEGIDFVKNKDMAGKVDDGLRAVLTFGDKLKQRVVKAVGKI